MNQPAGARVVVFSLGGTIAMTGDAGSPVVPALTAADLVASVPGLAETGVDIAVHDFRSVPGASVSLADLTALVAAAHRAVDDGADGVVVTQGTDTIEESAFALDLLWLRDAPLVVTGAMRNPTMAGADGPANLLAAVTTAAAPAARRLGCLVTFCDEIHSARWVRKTHTTSPGAFRSPNTGPIGIVTEGHALIPLRPARYPFRLEVADPVAVRTAVLPVVIGDDGATLRQAGLGLDGLVIAGFGAGHVPSATVATITELAAVMPVVLASRVSAGPILTRTYGFAGSESDLLSRGLISAGSLDCFKARILLHLLLAAGASRADIPKAFEAIDVGDVA